MTCGRGEHVLVVAMATEGISIFFVSVCCVEQDEGGRKMNEW